MAAAAAPATDAFLWKPLAPPPTVGSMSTAAAAAAMAPAAVAVAVIEDDGPGREERRRREEEEVGRRDRAVGRRTTEVPVGMGRARGAVADACGG